MRASVPRLRRAPLSSPDCLDPVGHDDDWRRRVRQSRLGRSAALRRRSTGALAAAVIVLWAAEATGQSAAPPAAGDRLVSEGGATRVGVRTVNWASNTRAATGYRATFRQQIEEAE